MPCNENPKVLITGFASTTMYFMILWKIRQG